MWNWWIVLRSLLGTKNTFSTGSQAICTKIGILSQNIEKKKFENRTWRNVKLQHKETSELNSSVFLQKQTLPTFTLAIVLLLMKRIYTINNKFTCAIPSWELKLETSLPLQVLLGGDMFNLQMSKRNPLGNICTICVN